MYSKEQLKAMDNDIKVKKFFKLIYRGFEEEREHIKIFQNDKDGNCTSKYFNDIDDVVNYVIGKNKYNRNTYFELPTTNGENGQEENLMYRYCLGFDFDKKDLGENFDSIDIINLFKAIPLHYNLLLDTGNGYHAYVCINKTNDFKKVEAVQKILCNKLKADENAIKNTQLLRVPMTYNVKSNEKKLVKIVAMDDRDEIKPYDIDFLYDKNCRSIKSQQDNTEKNNTYIMNSATIPVCLEKIINEGSEEGNRYNDLQRLVVNLRQRNKSLDDILSICKQWAEKSSYNDKLEYRVKNIYKNLTYVAMGCKECIHKNDCYNCAESEFDFDSLIDEDGVIYNTYQLEDKITKKIRNKQNRGANMLNGNEILIINVLRNEYDNPRPYTQNGCDIKMLMKMITCKKKSCLSERTLRDTVRSLVEKKFIAEEIGKFNKKYYKFNPIKSVIDNTIKISFFATVMCIARNITPSELSLYILMRKIHKQFLQENKTKGNIFVITQSDLAKAYYGDVTTENQNHISDMIKNLIEYHMIDIYEEATSKNNGYVYYKYRLNS